MTDTLVPDARDLTTLDRVKSWLNLTASADDAMLARLITAASSFIETWLGRPVLEQSVTEQRDGNGGCAMSLAVTPVASVAVLQIAGRSVPPAFDITTPGYRFGATRVVLAGYRFTRGLDNVLITYTGGYAETPPEVEQACIAIVGQRYRERDRIGLVSKGLAGETTSFAATDMPADAEAALHPYRKVIIA